MSVLWDVVRLREQGRRLPRDSVLSEAPVRGLLQLNARRPGWHAAQRDAPLLAGLVLPGDSRWVIPPLDEARVKVIRAEHMLIAGVEQFDLGRNRVERHRQAWWCRVVLETTGAQGKAPDPDDEGDDWPWDAPRRAATGACWRDGDIVSSGSPGTNVGSAP